MDSSKRIHSSAIDDFIAIITNE